jgi:hypothetical protein
MLTLLLAVAALAATSSPSLVDCQRTIAVEQEPVAPPAGWSAMDNGSPHRLDEVTFFDGPPAERASLKFDDEASAKKEWTGIWHFQPNPRGFWITCSYRGTSIVLSRRLPAEVKVCRVTGAQERRDGPVFEIKRIDCR